MRTGRKKQMRKVLEPSTEFGAAIMNARLKKRWYQTELAKRAGVGHTTVCRLENARQSGNRIASVEVVRRLEAALSLPPEYLVCMARKIGVVRKDDDEPQEIEFVPERPNGGAQKDMLSLLAEPHVREFLRAARNVSKDDWAVLTDLVKK